MDINGKSESLNSTEFFYYKGCATSICVTSLFSKDILNASYKIVSDYCCSSDDCNGDIVISEFRLPSRSSPPVLAISISNAFKFTFLIGQIYYLVS